ncbi:MAG: helix-turn-helix domain-containing protein [Bdellovibrionales bacterium]|nr:helix-turn-helix domain-containing protein [Bdellovibrionales bacterium]
MARKNSIETLDARCYPTPQILENGIERLWDVSDVAKFLNISKKTIYRWADQGTIPSLKLGKKLVRFRPEEVAKWALSNKGDPHGN